MNETLLGAQFLHERDSTLHTSTPVEWRQSQLHQEDRSEKPREKIASWLEVLAQTHGHNDEKVMHRIKESYYRQFE